MEGYLETLSGYINDEDKMVTYKWLSKELEVHVNVAKKILEEYWSQHKSNTNDSIVATIMLIGHTKDGEMRVEVVKEENLEIAKEKYEKIISEHLYSLQKSLPDIQLLAETGKGDITYGAIKCEKSNIRSDEELFAKRWGSNAKFEAATTKKSESSSENKIQHKPKGLLDNHLKPINTNNSNDDEKSKAEEKVIKTNSNSNIKNKTEEKVSTKKISPPKGKHGDKKSGLSKKPAQSQATGFQNLFGKATALNHNKSPPLKNKEKSKEGDDSSTENIIKENGNSVDTNNVKMTNNKSSDKPTTETTDKLTAQQSSFSEDDTNVFQKENKRTRLEEKEKINNGNSKIKINKKRGNKRQRSQESEKKDLKKRKRIIMPDDSSEGSAESEVEPDIFDDSPPRESPPAREKSPSPQIQQVNGKRKVRKAVDKTYQDEDGFLVTKKEYVYESVSDEEILDTKEVQEIKRTVSDSKPLSKTKSANKQTTLMNFFKKA
ncbi:DNA polymerase delta subunit 3 [Chelonus insularis]|uniref:DNA polymerase delta subunit 3 n=1 Tax=Chelonus insularis TaxID=460826 RepID=UPI0015891F7D|nr:DNA polymerase delta subunit 3 [Chelonus insularis]